MWIGSPVTSRKLMSVALAIRPAIRMIGFFFRGASRYEPSPRYSILALMKHPSVAAGVINRPLAMLNDSADVRWLPLAGCTRAWDEPLYIFASNPMWLVVGHIFRRFSWALSLRPWSAAEMSLDVVSDATIQRISDAIYDANDCCLSRFCKHLRGLFPDAAGMRSPKGRQFMKAVWEAVPSANVQSENRFSRQAHNESTNSGNASDPATVASNHLLGESKAILNAHQWRPEAKNKEVLKIRHDKHN